MIEVGDKVRIKRDAIVHCSFRSNTSYKPTEPRGCRPSMWIRPKGVFTVMEVSASHKTCLWWIERECRQYNLSGSKKFQFEQQVILDRPINPNDSFPSCIVSVKHLSIVRKAKKLA